MLQLSFISRGSERGMERERQRKHKEKESNVGDTQKDILRQRYGKRDTEKEIHKKRYIKRDT